MTVKTSVPLTTDTVNDLLVRRGLLEPDEPTDVEVLAGGVSGVVISVRTARRELVVKQALARLKVAAEWLSDPDRIAAEAAALRLAGAITPNAVPAVVDFDAVGRLLVLERVPSAAGTWKTRLLDGIIDIDLAARLGRTLGKWHAATAQLLTDHETGRQPVPELLFSREVFRELRIAPFYEAIARANPKIAEPVEQLAEQLLGQQICLVHGDFSPKNILIGHSGAWVVDWEVAHFGQPVFDVAFLLSHLWCKATRRPDLGGDYRNCAEHFLSGYRDTAGNHLITAAFAGLAGHVAALALARIDGVSPVDYLDAAAQQRLRAGTVAVLTGDHIDPAEMWRQW